MLALLASNRRKKFDSDPTSLKINDSGIMEQSRNPTLASPAETAPMKIRRTLLNRAALAASLALGVSFVLPSSALFAGKHPEPSVYPLRNAWYRRS